MCFACFNDSNKTESLAKFLAKIINLTLAWPWVRSLPCFYPWKCWWWSPGPSGRWTRSSGIPAFRSNVWSVQCTLHGNGAHPHKFEAHIRSPSGQVWFGFFPFWKHALLLVKLVMKKKCIGCNTQHLLLPVWSQKMRREGSHKALTPLNSWSCIPSLTINQRRL